MQIKNILAPGVADRHGTWHDCKADIKKCSNTQLQTMHGKIFRCTPKIYFGTIGRINSVKEIDWKKIMKRSSTRVDFH